MQRVAFIMKLKSGHAGEYKKRHDAIWPELKLLLTETGIRQYSIFLDEATGQLFGCLSIPHASDMEKLKEDPLMWKWWSYMEDIMETNPDHSPVSLPLKEVFFLP